MSALAAEYEVPADAFAERCARERFRVYVLRQGHLDLIATTPTAGGIGLAIVTLAEEGNITQHDRVGVLDTHGRADVTGDWLVSPFATGGR